MPDGTTRFTLKDSGKPVFHFMGISSFAEYTVVSEYSCAKVNKAAPLDVSSLLGCGISTGLGAVWNNTKVEAGSTVCVFGLGAVGAAVVQAAQMAGATDIVCVDLNVNKFPFVQKLGATRCINPTDIPDINEGESLQQYLVRTSPTGFGFDYTYDATGNTNVMRAAVECAHRGWGTACIIGVAKAGAEVATRPFQFVTGRHLTGTAFGGWKSRTDLPKLVERMLNGTLPIKHFITHRLQGVEATNQAIDILHEGNCLRCVVTY
jgi:S-(hydroxymethyl)glutathione dehydrogenase / alcohol dehydrogenase